MAIQAKECPENFKVGDYIEVDYEEFDGLKKIRGWVAHKSADGTPIVIEREDGLGWKQFSEEYSVVKGNSFWNIYGCAYRKIPEPFVYHIPISVNYAPYPSWKMIYDSLVIGSPIKKKSLITKMNHFFKKLTDSKVQELSKAGYLNGDLKPTQKAFDALNEVLFFEKYEELVAKATAENKEAEDAKKK
jgi:hypothetical protein